MNSELAWAMAGNVVERVEYWLKRAGVSASFEHPGVIYIPAMPGHHWCFGTVLEDWAGDLITGDDYTLVRQVNLGIPVTHESDGKDIAEMILRAMGIDSMRHKRKDQCHGRAVPHEILEKIARHESDRLNSSFEEELEMLNDGWTVFFPFYCTDCVGYHGPLVVACYGGSPAALQSWTMDEEGIWELCGQAPF